MDKVGSIFTISLWFVMMVASIGMVLLGLVLTLMGSLFSFVYVLFFAFEIAFLLYFKNDVLGEIKKIRKN